MPATTKEKRAAYQRAYVARNKEQELERKRAWRAANKDKIAASNKRYAEEHKEELKQKAKARLAADPEGERAKARARYNAWYAANKDVYERSPGYTEKVSARRRERYAADPNYKIRQRIHSDMWKITRGVLKGGWLMRLIGCTLDELSTHIEAQFQEGMTFDNLGEWEVDHIKQLSTFDLTQPEQVAQACHWTNLQPLWRQDNRGKGV